MRSVVPTGLLVEAATGIPLRGASRLELSLVLLLWAAAGTALSGAEPPARPAGDRTAASSSSRAAGQPRTDDVESPLPTTGDEIVVTVTGVEEPTDEAAAAVTVLSGSDLAAAAALTLDDTLRQVPGFTLFRRTGSRTANPTTQGASLRGIGGSGAGRVLLLADGVPLADPFGGWIAWGRVPKASIARVEVVRGGSSGLYGSSALAGVIHLVHRDPAAGNVVADLSGGVQETAAASVWAARSFEAWSAAVAADGLTTEGHVPLARPERGSVDRPAGTRHGSLELALERSSDAGPSAVLRAGVFDEERTNGTILQENASRIEHASAELDWLAAPGLVSLRAWGAEHELMQTFTAVAEDRESERLVRTQQVPSRLLGGSLRWTASAGDRHTLLLGGEAERREGISRESLFLADRVLDVASGGVQEEIGIFAQEVLEVGGDLSITGALRYDRWRNEPSPTTQGRPREQDMFSPRLAVSWQPRPALGLRASGYRSFRAPTLNELYRGFRVGDVVTAPNPGLSAERLTGIEVGANWTPPKWIGGLRMNGTLFWMHLDDPIANVTLAVDEGLIQRERQNLGRSRSRGVELDSRARLGSGWSIGFSGLWTDAEIVEFPADPELEGRRVAQVPELQASMLLQWRGRRAESALQARWSDRQYDDDRNLLALEEYLLADLRSRWSLGPRFDLYVAVENLLDEEVTVGRTPLRTVGSPRLLRLGLRWGSDGSEP